ncbi:MAG TPA: ABC transporter substrate-binding protein [Steroidobacter sp.]|uniref:ABC transporter substrate-binding protein n=1 Tax=Steroidobacter sp. TaxID=1978227 RepID=UPI002EDABCD6
MIGRLTLGVLLGAVWLAASSCASAAPDSEVLTVGVAADLGHLDLARSMRMPPALILNATNQTLIDRSNDAQTRANVYSPELARSWSSDEEGRVWTFVLEPGHRFDDGSEVTAAAVEYTFARIFGLKRGTASSFEFIQSVQALSRYEVRFTLTQPHPLFLPLVSDAAASIINPRVEAHAVEGDFASQWLGAHTAGSGPYRLSEYKPGTYYVLDRNPHHKGKAGDIRRVIIKVVRDEPVRRMQLVKGELDIALDLSLETIQALARNPDVQVQSGPSNAFMYLGLNTERGLMSDARVRRAVALSIDYEAILDGIFLGYAEEFRGPLPPGQPGAAPELYPVRFDPEAARRMIDELGIRRDRIVRMIYTPADPTFEPTALVIQASLQSIGLNVRLQQMSLTAMIDSLARGQYDIVMTGWVGESNDPAILINFWLDSSRIGSAGNAARYANPEVDRLLAQSIREVDPAERAATIRRLIAIANRDWPYIYLTQRHQWAASRTTLRGFSFNPNKSHDLGFHLIGKPAGLADGSAR